MAEGFVEQEQPKAAKGTPDLSRKPELAGKTVRRDGCDFFYDEEGYCVKCVKVQAD